MRREPRRIRWFGLSPLPPYSAMGQTIRGCAGALEESVRVQRSTILDSAAHTACCPAAEAILAENTVGSRSKHAPSESLPSHNVSGRRAATDRLSDLHNAQAKH